MHGEEHICEQKFVLQPEQKGPLSRLRCRCVDISSDKIWEGVKWMHLALSSRSHLTDQSTYN
jgi:hypothetical protein